MKRDIQFKFNRSGGLSRWRVETFWDKEPEIVRWSENFRSLPGCG